MADVETCDVQTPGDFVSIIISHIEDNAISFWAQLVSQTTDVLTQLEDIQDSLENLSDSSLFLNPSNSYDPDKIYFCCYEDGNYYRCKIIKKQGDDQEHFLVHYIDYGNTEIKSYRDIYCMDEKHEVSSIPPLCHKFILHNLKVQENNLEKVSTAIDKHFFDDSAKAKLHSHLSEIPTQVVLYDKDITNVNEMLVKMGLAERISDINQSPAKKEKIIHTPINSKSYEELEINDPGLQADTTGSTYFRSPNAERYQSFSKPQTKSYFMPSKSSLVEKIPSTMGLQHRNYNSQNLAVQRNAFMGFSNPLLDSDSESIEVKPAKKPVNSQKREIFPQSLKSIKNHVAFDSSMRTGSNRTRKLNGRSPEEEIHSLKLMTTKLQQDNDYYQKKIEELEAKNILPELIQKLNAGDAKVRDKKAMENFLQISEVGAKLKTIASAKPRSGEVGFGAIIAFLKLNYGNINILNENCNVAVNIHTTYWDYVNKIKLELKEKGASQSTRLGELIQKRNYLIVQFDRKVTELSEFKSNNKIDFGEVIDKLNVYLSKLSHFAVNMESDVSFDDICGLGDSEDATREAELFRKMETVKKTMQELVRDAKNTQMKKQLTLIVSTVDDFLKQKDSLPNEAKMHSFLLNFRSKITDMEEYFKDVEKSQIKLRGIIEGMPEICGMLA